MEALGKQMGQDIKKSEMKAIEEEMEKTGEEMGKIGEEMGKVQEKMGNVQSEIGNIHEKSMSSIGDEMGKIGDKMGDVGKEMEKIGKKMEIVGQKMEARNQKIFNWFFQTLRNDGLINANEKVTILMEKGNLIINGKTLTAAQYDKFKSGIESKLGKPLSADFLIFFKGTIEFKNNAENRNIGQYEHDFLDFLGKYHGKAK